MPKVSVIMPVYNTEEKYLRCAIESILNQTFTDFEFVILNDGSTNNAEDVILSYKDVRIKYHKQENQGIAKTLNNGLALAQGEYIARMDSDDISLPNRFQKQVEFLDKNKDISILGSWFELFPQKQVIKKHACPCYMNFLTDPCVGHPTVMFRKFDFEKYDLKYNSEYKCEDYELWSRAVRYLKFANIQEVLFNYRIHNNNLSNKNKIIFSNDVGRVHKNLVSFLTNDEKKQKEFIRSTHIANYSFIEKLFSCRNYIEFETKVKLITIMGMSFKVGRKQNVSK